MRTIKFRGKRTDNNEWFNGYFVKDPIDTFRIYLQPFEEATSNTYYFVEENSVGQFTGLHDKNGKEIYEGDILIHKTDGQFTIVWDNGFLCFAAKTEGSNAVDYIHSSYFIQCEIIGNIYENPELLNQ